MLGDLLAGNAEAVISYVKSDATVDYVDASVDVLLDFDSKNKEFFGENGETVTLSDAFSGTTIYSRVFTDSVSIGDELAIQFNLSFTDSISSSETFAWTVDKNLTESISTGDTPSIGDIHRVSPTDSVTVSDAVSYLHDGMLNTNMLNTRLLSVGSTAIDSDDVVITHIPG